MEVTHIHWSGKPIIGGIERHLYALIPRLNNMGCASQLICGNGEDSANQIVETGLSKETELNIGDFYQRNSSILDRSDIIHIHNGHVICPEKTELLFNFFKKRNKVLVLSVHNLDDCVRSLDVLRLPFNAFVTYSEFMRMTLRDSFEIDSSILPCYVNLNNQNVKEVQRGVPPVRILQPTRFSKWKGSHLSLEVISELLNEGRDLVFTHGGCKNLLFDQIKIPEDVKPWVENNRLVLREFLFDEIGRAIKFADIILHPTLGIKQYGEPFSLACLESMICGKPIIASESGFIPQLLSGYSRKQIIGVGNKNELYFAINNWLERPIPSLNSKDIRLIDRWTDYIKTGPSEHISFYSKLLHY